MMGRLIEKEAESAIMVSETNGKEGLCYAYKREGNQLLSF